MPGAQKSSGWNILPYSAVPEKKRLKHVRKCSYFAAGLLDRFPAWAEDLNDEQAPQITGLASTIKEHGLDNGLRRFRNRQMLHIIWRDLCGLASLEETFTNLTTLAELSLQAAIEAHYRLLEEKHGTPRGEDGSPQRLFVIGLGKFGGRELNLSSDIDVMFCYPQSGVCDGRRGMANDQFFTRLARGVIASLSEITEEGFCFRVDTRLRPFGDSGPLTSSLASLEQYYQREGREWERYALIKARPVAGDLEAGKQFIEDVRPFVYRRYIDYSSVEALQEMHATVLDDARRKDRLDDIKRGPGGIREIEFLAQCLQILRGGRETNLQTPSLDAALTEIGKLGLLERSTIGEIRNDYAYLRFLENRIQALRDQQTHRIPGGEDRERVALAMFEADVTSMEERLERIRNRVSERFQAIFPSRPEPRAELKWTEYWRDLRADNQEPEGQTAEASGLLEENHSLAVFVRRLQRVALSQRANQRLDRFMPELLERIEQLSPDDSALNRIFDLVLSVSRRSAYLVLLVQHPGALDRMLELFQKSEWIAAKVIRFPALLDELIDPSLGAQIPELEDLQASVGRILETAQGTEAVLEGLNYLKLATELRIAVGQLQECLPAAQAQQGLSGLATALLGGVLEIAGREIEARHGVFPSGRTEDGQPDKHCGSMAIIGYGTLGACELGYDSDLDIVFLFESSSEMSDGARPLPAERYYARLAQRILSFLTVMTPSGRLYAVDTRLRPNGRAGSLVSSISAFREYQLKEAWTWELQALTRARYVAGSHETAVQFNRIRQEVLCRERNPEELVSDLREMREKMVREQESQSRIDPGLSPKHRPGGLIEIEFIAQLGVLVSARLYPRVIQATGTLTQLRELQSIAWLSAQEHDALENTLTQLRSGRMTASLTQDDPAAAIDTEETAEIFKEIVVR
jgi:glutamate-ammonia-ligase adenylyltransferase